MPTLTAASARAAAVIVEARAVTLPHLTRIAEALHEWADEHPDPNTEPDTKETHP